MYLNLDTGSVLFFDFSVETNSMKSFFFTMKSQSVCVVCKCMFRIHHVNTFKKFCRHCSDRAMAPAVLRPKTKW